ncbi:sphingosine N-acyltransferase lag1, partial [Podila epigama]
MPSLLLFASRISDLSFKIVCIILLGSLFGNSYCRKMTNLSYRVPDEDTEEHWWTAKHSKGTDDLGIVAFWIIAFTYIRATIMKGYLNPLGKRLGIRGSKLERFEEQGYIVFYYVISWASGMALMYHSPHWLNTDHYWIGYPHDKISGAFKAYYL